MIFVTQIPFCTQNNTDSIWCLKKKNDVKNTLIFILVFYNNIHCSFVTLLSFFFNTEKMAWLSFICQFMFKVHETKSRTHLDMFCIYTPPPSDLPIQCCFDHIETIPFLWNVKRSDSLKFDHNIYGICTFICFLF